MFDIVKIFIDEFINFLPELSIICIVLSIVGNLVFRR